MFWGLLDLSVLWKRRRVLGDIINRARGDTLRRIIARRRIGRNGIITAQKAITIPTLARKDILVPTNISGRLNIIKYDRQLSTKTTRIF